MSSPLYHIRRPLNDCTIPSNFKMAQLIEPVLPTVALDDIPAGTQFLVIPVTFYKWEAITVVNPWTMI